MREVRFSKTFVDQLNVLLAQGIDAFGVSVVAQKRDLVFDTITRYLAHFPGAKPPDIDLGLHVHSIPKTPFVVVYDFDDRELRMHFIIHKQADRSTVDPASAAW